MTPEDLQQIQNLVTSSKTVWVLTHKNPSVDVMASALSLYLGLLKMGKNVVVAMEATPLVEISSLVGVDQVKTALSGKNLLITYSPYQLGDIEQVSYLEDETGGSSFKLTLTPRDGLKLDPTNFTYSNTGADADLIFTVDVVQPQDLGKLYNPDVFAKAQIINIDNHDENKDYGRFNLVEPNAATVSEITTFFLRAINAQLDADTSNNLYQGLVSGSNHFQSPKTGAATFEASAICLRSGAVQAGAPATAGSIPVQQAQQQRVEPQRNNAPLSGQVQPLKTDPEYSAPKVYRGTSVV